MCFCEQNYIKIKDYGKDSWGGRFSVQDESGTKNVSIEEAIKLVREFFYDRQRIAEGRETKKGEK